MVLIAGSAVRCEAMTSEDAAMEVARAASPFSEAFAALNTSPWFEASRLDDTVARSAARVLIAAAYEVQ
ncbi:hypothetical protein CLAC_04070 [Corynebacterium lactis RW2-5]|uniref:Uncharacterized protein n=1 Tax=Corynebacterium lactis RW2-5 TaxID=1408189 RepID=A0A0K2H427_9CORY|nr:hypothetical protein CLAC_04070 [Corynebacterium lactis RW2-5]